MKCNMNLALQRSSSSHNMIWDKEMSLFCDYERDMLIVGVRHRVKKGGRTRNRDGPNFAQAPKTNRVCAILVESIGELQEIEKDSNFALAINVLLLGPNDTTVAAKACWSHLSCAQREKNDCANNISNKMKLRHATSSRLW